MALTQLLPDTEVLLTDLPEAEDIVEINLKQAKTAPGSSISFEAFDWDEDLPKSIRPSSSNSLDLVTASDCTYNPDSRYSSR